MRIGILIIGSLFWDASRVRCRWRQDRLNCSHKRTVSVPIRYGKKTKKRGNTYTMVFARSCSAAARLGKALVVPVLAECSKPEDLIQEARCLWAAERDVEHGGGICADWGKVCVLKNPKADATERTLRSWSSHITEIGSAAYTALPTAHGEEPVLDPATGLALFDWPKDVATNEDLADFDLLLMTANSPSLIADQYPNRGADRFRVAGRQRQQCLVLPQQSVLWHYYV